ncbi:replication associated protein [Dipodfec virus UA23Rod_5718]|uniref:Replication-associated protein n=1 Tax=Dipodfec virus UA23Rod_5718 TaxID=2929256 RepID=A0A976R7L3_9VIRU|nr:replication associated protein [Dipodfec virus UA23Rod_5718]
MATEVAATQALGNTRPGLVPKSRAWHICQNQVDRLDELIENLQGYKSLQYLLVGHLEEAPTTGHHHHHIYAYFGTPIRLPVKKMCGAWYAPAEGSPKHNYEYLTKDGEPYLEIGERPHQGKLTVKELREMSADDVPPHLYNVKRKIDQANQKIKKADWSKKVEITYITGPSGIGKSTLAQDLADDEFDEVKHVGDFWTGVSDPAEGCCIYDDFRDSHMSASEFINFIDYRSHVLNTKGSFVRNRYTKIIITSVQKPTEIYQNVTGEPREQWLRRMTVIDKWVSANDIDIDIGA